jgi:hypothetical protein
LSQVQVQVADRVVQIITGEGRAEREERLLKLLMFHPYHPLLLRLGLEGLEGLRVALVMTEFQEALHLSDLTLPQLEVFSALGQTLQQ